MGGADPEACLRKDCEGERHAVRCGCARERHAGSHGGVVGTGRPNAANSSSSEREGARGHGKSEGPRAAEPCRPGTFTLVLSGRLVDPSCFGDFGTYSVDKFCPCPARTLAAGFKA